MNSSMRPRPRGFTLIELTGCAVMLVVATGLVAELAASLAAEARALDQRALALREADNALERLVAAGPTAWRSADAVPSENAQASLPGAAMKIKAGPESDGLIRLTVEVTWNRRAGEPARPVRLTTWGAVP